ncbi:hypothetical protein M885DRAFT_536258 [Pelagophyceae sp. CCMP2097]|nr:hypothetical protein M885DRAFT_536258 [Pelagophyceae sp. CCMP2097]
MRLLVVAVVCSGAGAWFARPPATPAAEAPAEPAAAAPEAAATCAEKVTVWAMANGASVKDGPSAVLSLGAAECLDAGVLDAAVSKAVCSSGARCRVTNGVGDEVSLCAQLDTVDGVLVAYAVPRDKRFVFSSEAVGNVRFVPKLNVSLVTLSSAPRMFEVLDFFSEDDADALVAEALAISDDEHKLMRSSTGAKGYHPSKHRTSDNAWVKAETSALSRRLQDRAFALLGFEGYDVRLADGIQVLRYAHAQGYVQHTDYLTRPAGVTKEAMDPAVGGANRLATLFLYLSDVEDGGQTVFPKVSRPLEVPDKVKGTLEQRSLTGDELAAFQSSLGEKVSSWEHFMVEDCYSKLAVRPKKGRAILYYSQHADGALDSLSTHGGCPVLTGEKWAANLWVWNDAIPFTSNRVEAGADKEMSAEFVNVNGREGLGLYWEDSLLAALPSHAASRTSINTYAGHRFRIKDADGAVVADITIRPGVWVYDIP